MTAAPSNRLFFADLPQDMTEDGVHQILGAYGHIQSVKVLPARQQGDKVAAIIEFVSQQEAEWICQNLNGNIAEGLTDPIVVRYANPTGNKGGGKAPAAGGAFKGGAPAAIANGPYSGGSAPPAGGAHRKGSGPGIKPMLESAKGILPGATQPRLDEACVYVRGLPPDTSDATLYELFCGFGPIAPGGVKAMTTPDGTCSGVGFIDYLQPWMAQQAIQALNGFKLSDGSSLFLKTKSPAKGKGKGKGKAKGDLV